jgi:hypothetical protein
MLYLAPSRMSCGKIVEHKDAFTGIDQAKDHLAADIAGADFVAPMLA